MLKNFRSDPLNAKWTEDFEKDFDINILRNEADDVELFDLLTEAYRQYAYHAAQEYLANRTLEDFWGTNEKETIVSKINGRGEAVESVEVYNNDFVTNSEIADFIGSVQGTNRRQRDTAKRKFKTKDLIDRYKTSVKKDEQLQLRINRDFRENAIQEAEQHRIEIEQQEEQTQEEEKQTSFVVQQMKDDAISFFNSLNSSERRKAHEELFTSNEDGESPYQSINQLYLDGAELKNITRNSVSVSDGKGGSINIPIADKFTHIAVRPDGTTMYLTKL